MTTTNNIPLCKFCNDDAADADGFCSNTCMYKYEAGRLGPQVSEDEQKIRFEKMCSRMGAFEHMLVNMITHLIDEGNNPDGGKGFKNLAVRAVKFDFRLRDGSVESMLLWAPDNYVYVFRRNEKINLRASPRNEVGNGWQHMSCHDSCWRTDGVDRFINSISKKVTGFDWLTPYTVVDVSAAQDKMLRQITIDFRKGMR